MGPAACHSKANKQSGWWKGTFDLFQMLAAGGGRVADTCPKADCPPPLATSGARAFVDRRKWLHAKAAWSALTVILTLVTDGLTSLVVLGTVNLQFQGPFIPISLRPVL